MRNNTPQTHPSRTARRALAHLWGCAVALVCLMACASPGQPDGGEYDEVPPRVIGASPAEKAVNQWERKVQINFDEYIRLENASDKVVISPPQIEMPEISASGRRIKVQLMDSLKPNTTYTIDFGDAIVDYNEGNPMGQYTYLFSTGDAIDTMEVSGYVLNAQNLEPVKGILVGLQPEEVAQRDSVLRKIPFERVARTNGSGRFTVKGVRPGTYRAYALQDQDGDFCFSQKSEMIAVSTTTFQTGSYPDSRIDTVWHDALHTLYDSLQTVPFTHYTPDDVVLLAFLENGQERHLLKSERLVPEHFELYFTAPCNQQPTFRGVNFELTDATFRTNYSRGNDTIQVWIADTTVAYMDTLALRMTYMETDTTGVLVEQDTLIELVPRMARERQLKLHAEELKKWNKEQERRKKRGMALDATPPGFLLNLSYKGSTNLSPAENVTVSLPEPAAVVDTSKIRLLLKEDSLWTPAPYLLKGVPNNQLAYTLYGEWRPEQEYRIEMDSAAFVSIYGHPTAAWVQTLKIPSLDTYAALFLTIQGLEGDAPCVVQLLNNADKVQATATAVNGHADFYFVRPGNYYVRAFVDDNGNGEWDTGDYDAGRQPERTYYYSESINLRARWDVDQTWNIHQKPIYEQKPLAITKQKPDKEKQIKNRNAERLREKNRRR